MMFSGVVVLAIAAATALIVGACETVLTAEKLSTDRARAVQLFGAEKYTMFALTVSGAGDLNGDGFDDVAISASQTNGHIGAVYVVFGRSAAAWASAQFDFNASDTPDPASWIRISGFAANTKLGSRGIAHGDFNGDGVSDLLLASDAFKAFCVFGHTGAWSSFRVTDIGNATVPGFIVKSSSNSGMYVGNAGDMNGDGIEDLLVTEISGTANIVFGMTGSARTSFDVSTTNGKNGFELTDGMAEFGFGVMGSAGDVNGDGIADLAIGSVSASGNAGCAYVLFARNASESGFWAPSLDLNLELDGTNGFIFRGLAPSSLGSTVFGAGDVNADGFADIFVGSRIAGSWIIWGHKAPWPASFNASDIDGNNGFHFASNLDFFGMSGGAAGDVNGDGFDDVLNGGYYAQNSFGTRAGAAAILFGHNGSWPAELNRSDAVGSVGFQMDGRYLSSYFGYSARCAGDINGDGLSDVIVGAYFYNNNMGYAVLVFGVPDDHCAVCSNTTDECLACDDGFILDGTMCNNATASSSSSNTAVVVIETGGGGGSASEIAAEVAQLLGVDVGQISVVEITPGTFEVTVINEEVAQQLVDLITQCIEEEEASDQ